jgi:hypothetical protein
MLAFRDVGLSKSPDPLLMGLPPMPRGLPPKPDPYFRPESPDELRGLCCIGVEKEDAVEPVKAR